MKQRYMLIDTSGLVIGEITDPKVIQLLSGVSILEWRGKYFVYSRLHRQEMPEAGLIYEIYTEVGNLAHLGSSAVEIRDA